MRGRFIVISGIGCLSFMLPANAWIEPGDWSYADRVLTRCDEAWFRGIMDSERFRTFIESRGERDSLDPIELGKLAVVASFLDSARVRWEVVIAHANSYSATALFCCLENHCGNPGQGGYRWNQFEQKHGPGAAPDLEAGFFAHIRDEPSHHIGTLRNDVFPIPTARGRIEDNMYALFSQKLQERNQPYMATEWARLSRFEKNPEARDAGKEAIRRFPPSEQARQFSQLVADIADLYRWAAVKQLSLHHSKRAQRLPAPYENLRAEIGEVSPAGLVTLSIDAEKNEIILQSTMREGDTLPLPAVNGQEYRILFQSFSGPWCRFVVGPVFAIDWELARRATAPGHGEGLPDARVSDPEYLQQFVGDYEVECNSPNPTPYPMRLKIELRERVLVATKSRAIGFADPVLQLIPCHTNEFTYGGALRSFIRFAEDTNGGITAIEKGNGTTWKWIRTAP